MLKRRERITHIWRPAKRLTFLLFSPHHRTGRCNNSCIFAKVDRDAPCPGHPNHRRPPNGIRTFSPGPHPVSTGQVA